MAGLLCSTLHHHLERIIMVKHANQVTTFWYTDLHYPQIQLLCALMVFGLNCAVRIWLVKLYLAGKLLQLSPFPDCTSLSHLT